MDNQKVIATLNNLLETTQDGVCGFVACAEGVTNPPFKDGVRGRYSPVR
jgi:hypothetical protein